MQQQDNHEYPFLYQRQTCIGNSFINTMKNINHTRSSISDDIRNILCSSANMRRAIPLILRLLIDRKSGSAGMPRPISYAVFCLKKKKSLDIKMLQTVPHNSKLAHAL